MDLKEPSVHQSHRSTSQRSRSTRSITNNVVETLDSLPQKFLNGPESKVMNRILIPGFIATFLQELVNMLLLIVVFNYTDQASIAQYSLALSITVFFSQSVPRAISMAQTEIYVSLSSESKVKQVDEYLTYTIVVQGAWFVISLIFAFIISVTLREQLGLKDGDVCAITIYVPVMMSLGTLLSIFNHAMEPISQFEGKYMLNIARSFLNSVMILMVVQLCYQFSTAKKLTLTLTQLCIGQIIGVTPATIITFGYFQSFKQFGYQGLLKIKPKCLKQFQKQYLKQIITRAIPKIFQLGSQPLLMYCCNIAITLTYTVQQDIYTARIGLLYYYQAFNLFGFFSSVYQNVCNILVPINVLAKKYIRSKTFMIKGFVYAIIFQAIPLIIGIIFGKGIVEFFIPESKLDSKELIDIYGEGYLTNGYLLPIMTIPLHFALGILGLENNNKITLPVSLIHPFIGILTLLVLQFTAGDRADLYHVEFYADIFSGIAGAVIYLKKLLEIMSLAKIELRRLKKKKKMQDDGIVEYIERKDV